MVLCLTPVKVADIIQQVINFDFEVGVSGDGKAFIGSISLPYLLAGRLYPARPQQNIYRFGRAGFKTIGAGQHNAQRFLFASLRDDSAAGDLAAVIDIGLLLNFHVIKTHAFKTPNQWNIPATLKRALVPGHHATLEAQSKNACPLQPGSRNRCVRRASPQSPWRYSAPDRRRFVDAYPMNQYERTSERCGHEIFLESRDRDRSPKPGLSYPGV